MRVSLFTSSMSMQAKSAGRVFGICAGEILLQIGKPISVAVLGGIGHILPVKLMGHFPLVWHAIAIRVRVVSGDNYLERMRDLWQCRR